MKRSVLTLTTGLLVGMVGAAVLFWVLMPRLMLTVHDSRLGFDDTVAAIQSSAEAHGWKCPKVYDVQKTINGVGHDLGRVTILSLCQPDHAFRILEEDSNKKVTAVMPCRMGVFETRDGRVRIAELNVGLMGRIFGGTIAKVMGQVAEEEKMILASVVQP